MNSHVIKYVAGGGKTTDSIKYMEKNKNGLYLAFNNKVVQSITANGFLGKTIDSFFVTYIIPKFICCIPLCGENKKVVYLDIEQLPPNLKGLANIKIDINGNIFSKQKHTGINLSNTSIELEKMGYFPNSGFIKCIFSKSELRLTDLLRVNIADYLIKNFPNEIISLLESRFDFVIIDEAQDLKDYKERFAELIYKSNIETIFLGDDKQNINQGGMWFETVEATESKKISFRCPESNCKWIRENLFIEIYGNDNEAEFNLITIDDIAELDNGKRILLYDSMRPYIRKIIEQWSGHKMTIRTAKGMTLDCDIVIIGKTLSDKNYYTAITRTTKNVFSTIQIIN